MSPLQQDVLLFTLMSTVDAFINMGWASSITEVHFIQRAGLGVLHGSISALALRTITQRIKRPPTLYIPLVTLSVGLLATVISTGAAAGVVRLAEIPVGYATLSPFIQSFLIASFAFLIADLSYFVRPQKTRIA